MTVLFLIIWTIAAVFFGTATIAARYASRTRLTMLLGDNDAAEARANAFFSAQDEIARTCVGLRQLTIVTFVLTLFLGVAHLETLNRWLTFWAICLPWLVVVGVALPTSWAQHAGEEFLGRSLPLLFVLRGLSRPLLLAQDMISEIVRRLTGAPINGEDGDDRFEERILDVVRQGETHGSVQAQETEMIRSVMFLDETSVGEIMTPRTDVTGVDATADYDTVRDLIRDDGHSRYPVYEDSLDNVVGMLYAKDMLNAEREGFSTGGVMRPVTFVPETKDLASLLREFQNNRVHIAIVLDEYGGTAGLVTFEDILEELVGEIADEHERPPESAIKRIDPRTYEIDARVRVEEINEDLNMNLPDDDAYDTVGGFVLSKLGRIPAKHEALVEGDIRIEVLDADQRSINRLQITRLEAVPEE